MTMLMFRSCGSVGEWVITAAPDPVSICFCLLVVRAWGKTVFLYETSCFV